MPDNLHGPLGNVSDCADPGDTAWISLSTILVLTMMPALALFEAGLLRSQNTVSVLTQVVVGMSINTVLWFLVGFSLVFGESLGGVIGNPGSYAAFRTLDSGCLPQAPKIPAISYAMFEMMFAAIAPLLLTGAFSERLLWRPFVCFNILWEVFVYYPVAHWIWGDGFLSRMGVQDFAGGIVIHATAGAAAIVSAIILGRRCGFFENDGEFPPSSLPIACIGGAMLWMGWFGFNAGSSLSASTASAIVVANTQLASAACALVWVGMAWLRTRPNVVDALNGAIAGLAGITPAAGYVSPPAAFLTGIVLGFGSYFSLELIRFRLHVDDALDVSSVHGVPGIIGALVTGLAGQISYGSQRDGLFFGGGGYLLGVQVLGIVVASVYSAVVTWAIFSLLKRVGPLSVEMDAGAFERSGMELTNLSSFHLLSHVGLDKVEHDIEAYRHNPGWHPNNPQTGFSQSMHEPLLPHDARVSPVQHAHQRLKGWKQTELAASTN